MIRQLAVEDGFSAEFTATEESLHKHIFDEQHSAFALVAVDKSTGVLVAYAT